MDSSIVHPKRVVTHLQAKDRGFMPKSAIAVVGHLHPRLAGPSMSGPLALSALAALGQTTRLDIIRLLIRREPDGMAAGAIAAEIDCVHNTLSAHLAILARAALVTGTRDGRSIIYRANIDGMRALVWFLIKDCCDGRPELCDLLGVAKPADSVPGPGSRTSKRRK
jgi:ArsR family transcriptional regulator, arsenate/arsenite/antimonite-responsive transcriptional repressor